MPCEDRSCLARIDYATGRIAYGDPAIACGVPGLAYGGPAIAYGVLRIVYGNLLFGSVKRRNLIGNFHGCWWDVAVPHACPLMLFALQ